ncbi:HupE/UreJ family protein [Microbacter sp. GSS18]|nr:HupE/UreJ family protein [Microbacter sp. GSS18]
MGRLRRLSLAASVAVTGAILTVLAAPAASAHSLESSTVYVVEQEDGLDATISIALETLDDTLGTDYATAVTLSDADTAALTAYIADHFAVLGADGQEWAETYSGADVEVVDGITSFTVDVALDADGADTTAFTIEYDAIIEADAGHEAVVVLKDLDGQISTAGVIDASNPTLQIGDTLQTGLWDMIGYGFEHVLAGADHLLFLLSLLLVAPLTAAARRWRPREDLRRSVRGVIGVVTAFTVGHSLTLIASALGWISLPTALIETLVAASVAVAAVHAVRPLVPRGELVIAGGFGLVHGLAFAGILGTLGLDGSLSVLTLLAFNLGVELAQLAAVALVFPALFVLSRTRWYTPVRVGISALAFTAAVLWILDRTGVLANPLAGLEDAAIAHTWILVVVFAALAAAAAIEGRVRGGRAARRSPA